jgi:hypothetical protein
MYSYNSFVILGYARYNKLLSRLTVLIKNSMLVPEIKEGIPRCTKCLTQNKTNALSTQFLI